MTFLRAFLALPFLAATMKVQKIPFASTPGEMRDLILAGLGSAVTTMLLYGSYAFISICTATTLHFIYPVVVSLLCFLIYKDKLNLPTLIALALSSAGVYLSSGKMEGHSSAGF